MNFNDFIWHDAVIENISIDRNNPGINDSIKFDICWPSNDKSILIFEDVYWANFNLNFGIIGDESILYAQIAGKEDQSINDLYLKWKGLINDVILNCYIIVLNTTASEIKIISKGFKIVDSDKQVLNH